MSEQALESVAYHEAGHFVAGLHLEILQFAITIIPDEDKGLLGAVAGEVECFVDDEGNLLPGVLEQGESDIVYAMAGYIAEVKKFDGAEYKAVAVAGASSDFENIDRLAEGLNLEESRIDQLRQKTELLINDKWHQVELLAEVLLVEKRIDAEAAEIICEMADGEEPGALLASQYPFLVDVWAKVSQNDTVSA
jgi:ATP-dependent Zn protease